MSMLGSQNAPTRPHLRAYIAIAALMDSAFHSVYEVIGNFLQHTRL